MLWKGGNEFPDDFKISLTLPPAGDCVFSCVKFRECNIMRQYGNVVTQLWQSLSLSGLCVCVCRWGCVSMSVCCPQVTHRTADDQCFFCCLSVHGSPSSFPSVSGFCFPLRTRSRYLLSISASSRRYKPVPPDYIMSRAFSKQVWPPQKWDAANKDMDVFVFFFFTFRVRFTALFLFLFGRHQQTAHLGQV